MGARTLRTADRLVSIRWEASAVAGCSDELRRAQRLSRMAMLCAVALVLGFLETMIPLPGAMPGMKLGLSNVAVVVALFLVDGRAASQVALVKVLATGFLFGSPLMIAYSAAGTVLALACMLALRALSIEVVALSMAAAVAHNVGQLVVAAWFLGTWAIVLSAPYLAAAACVTGAATGWAAGRVIASLPSPGASGASCRAAERARL